MARLTERASGQEPEEALAEQMQEANLMMKGHLEERWRPSADAYLLHRLHRPSIV